MEVPAAAHREGRESVGGAARSARPAPGRRPRTGHRLGDQEIVIQLLATRTEAGFEAEWARLQTAVRDSTLPEPKALFRTLTGWKAEIRTFCLTRITNAKTEAANLGAKNIKRAGRGYRNHGNYRARILLTATARTAA